MIGFTPAAVSTQPSSSSIGTYTGAMNRIRKVGVCISGPAWSERNRSAIPDAYRTAARQVSVASRYSPSRSTAPPPTCIPTASAITVSITHTNTARDRAASAYPATIADRRGAASISRRPKPDSKSRAMAKPVNTPPKAEAWSSTNTNWKAV